MSKKEERDDTRINYQIQATRNVLVIYEGDKLGLMPVKQGIFRAKELGLDLVEVSPNSNPQVCIITDYGKYKYDKSKKQKSNQSQKQETKTIRFRQNIDDHDVEIKIKAISKFLKSGKKVQLVVRSKGRELAHKDRSFEIVSKILEELKDTGKAESPPKSSGNDVSCRIDPV